MAKTQIISASNFVNLIKENKKISETIIPELIQRLIRQSINSNTYTHFHYGDDIFAPGFDGIVKDNIIEHRFLQKGSFVVEIGVITGSRQSISKIKKDYSKRKLEKNGINKSEYNYIAISTAILNSTSKQKYSDKYNNEAIFRKVIILDAIDITSWLGDHINIGIWLLRQYGMNVNDYDITLLEDEWNRFALCTEPNLTTNIVLIDNERNSDKFIYDIENIKNNRIITISSQYYGRDFAYYFCIASFIATENLDIRERVLIVNSQAALNFVNAFCCGKIVLINFNCFDDRFVSSLNNTYIFFDTLYCDAMQLDLIKPKNFQKQVEQLGLSPDKSHKISFIVDNNVLALRRLLAKIPTVKVPLWSKNNNKNELIPLLLMGEIKMDNDGDIDFLKSMIGEDIDSYTEKLNVWSEMNESPILKFENIYRICSRKECFDFLQIDVFSLKLRALENQLLHALTTINNKYENDSSKYFVNDENYIWRDKLIENVVNGFIILSEKKRTNQMHFDVFVDKIFSNIKGNYILNLTIAHFFYKFSELSPRAFLNYMKKSLIEDKDSFIKFINTETVDPFVNIELIHYIINSFENTLKIKDYSIESLELILDLYYLVGGNYLTDKILDLLSPIYTMEGLISLKYLEKIKFFFNYIIDKDDKKTEIIVERLYNDSSRNIMIDVHNTYSNDEQAKIIVTYNEIFESKSMAFKWLVEHEKSDKQSNIKLLKNLLSNIHNITFDKIKEQLKTFIDINQTDSDKYKADYIVEILEIREKILQFSEWENLKIYIPLFNDAITSLMPNDEYYKCRYVFVNDNFPLENPPSADSEDCIEKENELRDKERRVKLDALIKKRGKDVIKIIIKDVSKDSYSIWPIIYEYSDDHYSDIEIMVHNSIENGLRCYFNMMSFDDIKNIISKYKYADIILKNLPFKSEICVLINDNPNENVFWENHNFNYQNNEKFEYIFGKFIKFAPYKLLGPFAYHIDCDYQHGIDILNAISKFIENGNKEKILNNEEYSLQELVHKMDIKYYTQELSLCEFNLLKYLKSGVEDYPMGIKKYLWERPDKLGKILVQLSKQKDKLNSESIGRKILFEAYCTIGGCCYIPKEYIFEYREKIKEWSNNVILQAKDEDEEIIRLVKSAVINTLACCPKNIQENIWPIVEVADILEEISKTNYDNKYRVSSNFYCGYINRRGFRNVEDGSAEFELSEEFKKYQEFYRCSHPVTSKALEYISNNYNSKGEMDKTRSYLGFE